MEYEGDMASNVRVEFVGALRHVLDRGDRREPIFKNDAGCRRFVDAQRGVRPDRIALRFLYADEFHSHRIIEAPQTLAGAAGEEWTLVLPSAMRPRFYSAFVIFYDASEAAWKKKLPPDDPTFVLKQFDLGGRERRPGGISD